MHVRKVLLILICSLPHLLAAPIHDDLPRVLIEARTVDRASNIVSANPARKRTPAFYNIASSSQLHTPVSAAPGSALGRNLKLVAQSPGGFGPPLAPSLAAGAFGAARTRAECIPICGSSCLSSSGRPLQNAVLDFAYLL